MTQPAVSFNIDIGSSYRFVEALAGIPAVSANATWLAFDDVELPNGDKRGDRSLTAVLHGGLNGCGPELARLNSLGAGVFITINETDLRGKASTNVVALRALFIDKDDGQIDEHRITLPPSLRVRTRQGEHAYWLLRPGEDREAFKAAQKQLIAHFQSDISIHNLDRVMRLPGFYHNKHGAVMLNEVWYGDVRPSPNRFTIAEVLAAYPSVRLVGPQAPPRALHAVGVTADVRKGGRNVHLAHLAGVMRSRGMSAEALLAALQAENAQLPEPLDAAEVSTIAASIARYEPSVDAEISDIIGDAAAVAATSRPPRPASAPYTLPNVDPGAGGGWLTQLATAKSGAPYATHGNAVIILANDTQWTNCFRYNARALKVELTHEPPHTSNTQLPGPYPRDLTDEDSTVGAAWFCSSIYRMPINKGTLYDAMVAIGRQKPFDPIIDYLHALPAWDGMQRAKFWLIRFAGAADSIYTRAVSKRFLIQAIARAEDPGCQADATLILEGPQGRGKSSLLRVLFSVVPGGFSEDMPPIDSKDTKGYIHGPWCAEMSELNSMIGRSIEATKAFLTLRYDRFRGAYLRTTEDHLRRVVFAATTNKGQYLHDETGARRFHPVACGTFVDLHKCLEERDQLWAEALYRYEQGEQWHLTDDEIPHAEAQQEIRFEADALEHKIRMSLDAGVKFNYAAMGMLGSPGANEWGIVPNCASVSVEEIIKHVCEGRAELDTKLQYRIARIMRSRLRWVLSAGRYWRPVPA